MKLRSWPMVVKASWPGRTRVSSGSFASFFRDSTMASGELSGKSTRPCEVRKSVSPQSKIGASPASSL